MHSLIAILTPVVMLAAPVQLADSSNVSDEPGLFTSDTAPHSVAFPSPQPSVVHSLSEPFRPPTQAQVRIERRVIVRISPQTQSERHDVLDDLPREEMVSRFREQNLGKCIPLGRIAGVQVYRDSRLLLFMRDRRVISAALEKSCSPRDFYSGFYVEPNDDGMICIGRDKLQSRIGAKCELSKLARLVQVKD